MQIRLKRISNGQRNWYGCAYDLLEILGDEIAAAIGPGPRESVVIQHPRHDVVNAARRLDKLLTLEVIVVWHVQPIVPKQKQH